MTHAYITLDTLKGASALNITGTANDDRLLRLAEAGSSVIDRWCNRHFFTRRATLRFDGSGEATLGVPDLVSVDSDGVRTYDAYGDSGYGAPATVWDADDYNLLPFNADPASVGNPISRPYTRLLATGTGGRSCFPPGRGNVEVSGVWGWWQHHSKRITGRQRCCSRCGRRYDAHGVRYPARRHRTEISAGHTLLIGDEQVYVRASDSGTLTVERGVNGTTASAVNKDSSIAIYEYPPPVSEAALLLAARMWRGALGGVDDWQAGEIGMDSDIGLLLSPYRKPALGVFCLPAKP